MTAAREDLTGKLVRWESDGQWFTATVEGTGVFVDSCRGTVVDPGNFTRTEGGALRAGQVVPNLLRSLITVVGSELRGEGKDGETDGD